MEWLKPKDEHIIYEALSAIADKRSILVDDLTAKCTSTSRGKFYTVTYDPKTQEIMSNDNMAYYRSEISYPMVAMIILKKEIDFDNSVLEYFKNIPWKDLNQKNKNDYMKSVNEFLMNLKEKNIDIEKVKKEVEKIYHYINNLNLKYLGRKTLPPNAY